MKFRIEFPFPCHRLIVFIFTTFMGLAPSLYGQNFHLDWAFATGDFEKDLGFGITADTAGNVYVTGGFSDTIDFDPGPGVFLLEAAGAQYSNFSAFVQKLDANGNLVWAKGFGDGSGIMGQEVILDSAGNVYVMGNFKGQHDMDPGPSVSYIGDPFNHIYDIFILKLGPNGDFLWARSLETNSKIFGNDLQLDQNGDVYVVGSFEGTADLDPEVGISNYTSAGQRDAYIVKMDGDGNLLWIKQRGGASGDDEYFSIAFDSSGNILVGGGFEVGFDFDPGPSTNWMFSDGYDDVFMEKWSSGGGYIWSKIYGGDGGDVLMDIIIDERNNILMSGTFTQDPDFDPGPGSFVLGSNDGDSDAFVSKWDENGNFIHAITPVSSPQAGMLAREIELDNKGNIFVSGSFAGTADFDPGPGSAIFTSTSPSFDVFFWVLDSNLNYISVDFIGNNQDYEHVHGMHMDEQNNLYITGEFDNVTLDIDPDTSTYLLYGDNAYGDIFVAKYGPCRMDQTIDTIMACGNTYMWIDGNTYSSPTTTASYTLLNSGGCDSVITLSLSFLPASFTTDSIVACDSLSWTNGITYTSSNNTALDSLTDQYGCDSIVTLNLNLNYSSLGTDSVSACGSFLWMDGITYSSTNNTAQYVIPNQAGCDSLVTLNLALFQSSTGTDIVSDCDSFIWMDGNTYFSSNNTATHSVLNTNGCDSLITLDLTISQSSTYMDQVSSCDPITWMDGTTYSTSISGPTVVLPNNAGCDSVISLDFTLSLPSSFTDVINSCGPIVWIDGNTYTNSNSTATHSLVNSLGCDSTVILDLTISPSLSSTDSINSCGPYLWIDGNTYTSSISGPSITLQASGGCDSIVSLELSVFQSSTGTDGISSCDPITWIDGNTYTSSTITPSFILENANGCDSVVTLDLTILDPTTGIDSVSSCGAFTWMDGNTYASSNSSATHIIPNQLGCDSIITLHLEIHPTTYGTDIISSCGPYTWINGNTYASDNNSATHILTNNFGCDSVITLDLTIQESSYGIDNIVACNSYTWLDGNTYTSSDTNATYTLANSMGCDSILHLDLQILFSPGLQTSDTACQEYELPNGTIVSNSGIYYDTIPTVFGCDSINEMALTITSFDTGVNTVGTTLQSAATNVTYQWLDCSTLPYQILPGQTAQTYSPTQNGQYAVQLFDQGCDDYSDCIIYNMVGNSNLLENQFSVFPNPFSEMLIISIENNPEIDFHARLYNILGEEVAQTHSNNGRIEVGEGLAKGTYLLKISRGGEDFSRLVTKY